MTVEFFVKQKPLEGVDAYLIEVHGAIDMSRAMELEEIARGVIHTGKERLVFDLSNLVYINTKGLGVLLTIQKTLDAGNGRVIVVGASGRVKSSIEITGLNRIIQLYSHLEGALESLDTKMPRSKEHEI